MAATRFFTYILLCSDNTLYIGYTTDIDHRLMQHNLRKGAKYTRGRAPVVLVYCEELQSKSEALKRECQLKKLSRQKKIALSKNWLPENIFSELFGNRKL